MRISDDSVEEVPIERVLAETQGTFMLYYERILQPQALVAQPNASEETLKPAKPEEVEVKRARSVARVVHAFGRSSRSPSVLQEGSSTAVSVEPSPAPEALDEPVHVDEVVGVEPTTLGPASEDAATVVAKDIEEATSAESPAVDETPLPLPNGDAPDADTPTSPTPSTSTSSSRISKRKGKVKRPPAVVELRA